MKKFVVAGGLLIGAVATAHAAPQCFRPTEIEAAEAMRYQAKLMVLSDTCRSDAYSLFVHRNSKQIVEYQKLLIERYRVTEGRRAVDAFDSFQTRLANEYALEAGHTPVDALCAKSAEFLSKAPRLGGEEFRQLVMAQAGEAHASYPSCAAPRQQAAESR